MYLRMLRAAIPVMLSVLAIVSTGPKATAGQATGKAAVSELWLPPQDIGSRDLFHGPGGPALAPSTETPFTWIATDEDGFSRGFDVRGPDGREWSVKLGPEAQTEVVVSRILWAIGYHQPPTYYLARWTLTGGPGGEQPGSRFRAEVDEWSVTGEWSWTENPFVHTQAFRGLIVANVLLNSWDWKTSNNKVYEHADGQRRFVVRDVGASLGRTSSSRLLWLLPMRGFGQGTRNDLEGFEAAGFIESAGEGEVDFHFETIYGDVIDIVRPADVKWTAELLSRVSDAQWDAAFRAGGYDADARGRYIRKIKAKIAEGLAVS
jgi:hypothetical protein